MSLVAVSAHGIRLLRSGAVPSSKQLYTATARKLSSASKTGGGGLRRAQTKERHSSRPAEVSAESSPSSPTPNEPIDPHILAQNMIDANTDVRIPGTEAILTLTNEQRIWNFAMAGSLFAGVTGIFYYSMYAVGGESAAKQVMTGGGGGAEADGKNAGFEEFLREANEGRSEEDRRVEAERKARGEAKDLVDADFANTKFMKEEGVEQVIVAASADEAELEKAAGFGNEASGEKKQKPLWRRVVFFWRRD